MSKISETFHIFFDQLTGNPKTMRQARFSARRSGPVALLLLRQGQPRREFWWQCGRNHDRGDVMEGSIVLLGTRGSLLSEAQVGRY